ncbi:hypothetical protein RDV89_10705 [Nocardioides zeae]|uniref:Uncharacterized protein n=1 Tax=Nocardioides imazamoxiresistens TaxID=3231893 RepID=A0ABU3PWD1_9ACTN|nr:hypothetical protein [Nocardioides zeae]MDT9593538.1 hypothetical protein [Nocardioides zeae]
MKKLLVAALSAVLMTVGLAATGASVATAAPAGPSSAQYPGTIGTYAAVSAAYPYRYGGVAKPKRLAVWYGGRDGERITGRVYVTTRKNGTTTTTTVSYWYNGFGRNVWTNLFSQPGSHQITVAFQPSDSTYRNTQTSYWIWISPR